MDIDWALVDLAAEQLGVSPEARRKWKQRGAVPAKFWLAIGRQTKGRITPEVLERAREEA